MTEVRLDAQRQVRLGGLGIDAAKDLTVPARSSWFAQSSIDRRALVHDRERLSDALHIVIGATPTDDPERKTLVKVRRDLFNEEWRRALVGIDQLQTQRTATESALGQHLTRLRSIVDAATELESGFDRWLAQERSGLAASSTREGLLRGIAISSPSLVPSIRRYVEHIEAGTVDKKDRKTERSLLSYVLRSSVKTSPFSTLGLVSLTGSGSHVSIDDENELHVETSWSVYPLARIFNALPSDPTLLDALSVQRSPYVRRTEKGLEVERTRWSFKDLDSGDDYAASVESVVTINQESIATAVSEMVDEEMTFGELVHALADSAELDADRSRHLVTHLLQLGYLDVPALVCHPHNADSMRETVQHLRVQTPGLATVLEEYFEAGTEFSTVQGPEQRLRALEQLRSLVETAYEEAEVDGALPRSVVYEDAIAPAHGVTVAGLDGDVLTHPSLRTLIDLQDDANLKHALMTGYYLHRWGQDGSCTDVNAFLSGFETSLLDSFEGYDIAQLADDELADDPWLRWGEAWRWVIARRRLGALLTGHTTTEPLNGTHRSPEDIDDIDITDDLMRIAEVLPQHTPPFRHLNLLLQEDGVGGWVLNDSFGGVGFPVSRFSHLVENPRAYTKDVEETAAQAGVVLAEITGGALFTNLNAHDPVVSAEIVVPGDPTGSYSERTIALDQLRIEYAPEQGRTVLLDDQGAIVHPIYSGYLVPAATPRHHQVLSLFGPTGNFSRKPFDNVETRPEPGTVLRAARMRLGEVVVSRARVLVPAMDCPQAKPLSAAGYAEWTEFWSSNALPTRSFVRILDDSGDRYKPQYHDATVVLCFSVLFNALRGADATTYVEISEALPSPGEGTAAYAGHDRAYESMIGISILEGDV